MMKIIRGKKYDTDTARLVGTWEDNPEVLPNEVGYYAKSLYVKRTGEYFIHVNTGTVIAEGHSGDRLDPVPAGAAKNWAKNHLAADEYEAEFGSLDDDEGSVTTSISLPKEAYGKLKRLALKSGEPVSKYLGKVIKNIKEETE